MTGDFSSQFVEYLPIQIDLGISGNGRSTGQLRFHSVFLLVKENRCKGQINAHEHSICESR